MSAPAYQSITDFYRDPASPYAGFAQEHRAGGSMPIQLFRAQQDAFQATNPATDEINLAVALKADMLFRCDTGDGFTDERRSRSGDFNLLPHNTERKFWCSDSHDLLNVGLPANPLATILYEHGAGTLAVFDPLADATLFRDQQLMRIVTQLWTESARAGGTSDLLIDGLVQVLIARLLDKAGAIARPVRVPTLSQDEIVRLDRLIADQLAERITVETLAQALDMPRWTFADAFKATTGETPHAYVTARRLERACDLLRLGDMPLAEIAYATGFASQSHMTDTFRRVLDTTPGAWRREVRR